MKLLLLVLVLPSLLCAAVAPSPKSPPNILFAIADDWGPHASAYGQRWIKTPAFDRVAREGLLFKHAYTPNAKCAPSRACILTGRNSWQLEAAANHICHFPSKFKGWAEALAEQGWNVGHTTKGWGPGRAVDAQGKPRQMTGKSFNRRKAEAPTSEISNCDYAANFNDFLKQAPAGKPWCFWFGAIEPHRAYEPGSGIAKGGKKLSDIDHVPAYWPDTPEVRSDLLDYAFEVEHFDAHLGRMLAELERRQLLDNTLVIVTADHGMPFPRSKGNINPQANHVPLAMRWKGGIAKPGRVLEDMISFVDLAPTLIEIAGLSWAQTGMAPSAGRSLSDLFADARRESRDFVVLGRERNDIGRPQDQGYPVRALLRRDSILIENFEPKRWPVGNPETGYLDCDGGATKTLLLDMHRRDPASRFWQLCFGLRPPLEFYDLKTDPDFVDNRPEDLRAESMRRELHSVLKAQGDPRMLGQGELFDRYPHANEGHRGFYERVMAGEKIPTNWINPGDVDRKPLP